MPTTLPMNITTYTFIVISLGSKTDAHTVLYDRLTNAMLALFDQSSNHNVTLLPYKEKVNYYFHCFG